MWFDPDPVDTEDRFLSIFMGETIARPWDTFNDDVGQLRIRSLGNHVWVGSGASLLRVWQPPLGSNQ